VYVFVYYSTRAAKTIIEIIITGAIKKKKKEGIVIPYLRSCFDLVL
jgi:hypothetical protein